MRHVTLAEIAAMDESEDIILWFGQFLDDFRHERDKESLIAEEPVWKRSRPGWMYYNFAAAAHKLANDNGIPVPEWAMAEKYISPEPIYGRGVKSKEYQEYLRKTSPYEYASRNIFLGNNVLSRI